MYICPNCGAVFETPRGITIRHTSLSGRTHEDLTVCPVCDDDTYEPATRCSTCDAYISETQARFGLCADCEIDAETRFRR